MQLHKNTTSEKEVASSALAMTQRNLEKANALAELVRSWNAKGWSPATSTNYSFRDEEQDGRIWISGSGIDKSEFAPKHFMAINPTGKPYSVEETRKPSAETLIHTFIYEQFPEVNSILHTHSIGGTVLSRVYPHGITLENYELQKAFQGEITHEKSHLVPVFENKQDIAELVEDIKSWLDMGNLFSIPALVLKQHGTYVWGRSIQDAKRHLEAIEFLFACELKYLSLKA